MSEADLYAEVTGTSAPASSGEVSSGRTVNGDEALRTLELIQLSAEIDSFLGAMPTSEPLGSIGAPSALDSARRRFVTLFREELDVVRGARDAVVHARPLDPEVLDGAVELARELVRIINRGQEAFGAGPTTSSSV